jgi:hypothetical protein
MLNNIRLVLFLSVIFPQLFAQQFDILEKVDNSDTTIYASQKGLPGDNPNSEQDFYSVTILDSALVINGLDAEYQWIDCNTLKAIPEAVHRSFTPSTNGDYAVVVTKQGSTDTSQCYPFLNNHINRSTFENSIAINHDASSGSIILDLGKELCEVMVFIKNSQNEMVRSDLLYHVSFVPFNIPDTTDHYTVEILTRNGDKAILDVTGKGK